MIIYLTPSIFSSIGGSCPLEFGGCSGEDCPFHITRLCCSNWRSPAPAYAGHLATSCLDFPLLFAFRLRRSKSPASRCLYYTRKNGLQYDYHWDSHNCPPWSIEAKTNHQSQKDNHWTNSKSSGHHFGN